METLNKTEFADVVSIIIDLLERIRVRKFNNLAMTRHVFLTGDENKDIMEITIEVKKYNSGKEKKL